MHPTKRLASMLLVACLAVTACGDDDTSSDDDDDDVQADADTSGGADADVDEPDAGAAAAVYEFESRFVPGESSVAYAGQTFRHVLIADLVAYIESLTAAIDAGTPSPAGEVQAGLQFYFGFDATTSIQAPILLGTQPPPEQAEYGDISAGADLRSKLAGNLPDTDHADWSTEFVGWSGAGGASPEALLLSWFAELDMLANGRSLGTIPLGADGEPIAQVYVTPEGRDLKQLIQKFLLGAVVYARATDEYLDDGTAGAGLDVSNARVEDKPYSQLEHHWDEAFGYFGAARDYAAYTDEEIAGAGGRDGWSKSYHDTDADGAIDLLSELNFGNSQNAGKRDLGSAAAAPTDFTKHLNEAFLRGRAIIAGAGDELTAEERTALLAERDIIVAAWEQVIAATMVHYINESLQDLAKIEAGVDYVFLDHAEHWSELKGFALGLQFNPRSALTVEQFTELHAKIGDAPVVQGALGEELAGHRADLLEARALIQEAYGFDPANMGDDAGEGGW
jgi:hypothetical protein